jgi:hypothetical protein
MDESKKEKLTRAVQNVKDHLRITKVVCTRTVKGPRGDHYVGFAGAWDSIQDDAGGASELIGILDAEGKATGCHQQGMTLKEAKLASLILGLQADIAAHDNAVAGGNLSIPNHEEAVKTIRHNYSRLLADLLGEDGDV